MFGRQRRQTALLLGQHFFSQFYGLMVIRQAGLTHGLFRVSQAVLRLLDHLLRRMGQSRGNRIVELLHRILSLGNRIL